MTPKYPFSRESLAALETCDVRLQILCHSVANAIDIRVIEGSRGKSRQNHLFRSGLSKVQWPNSKHNIGAWWSHGELIDRELSLAVDVVPWPIDWNDRERFVYCAGIFKGAATELGIPIRWGGDWDRDNDLRDQKFMDLAHYELLEAAR